MPVPPAASRVSPSPSAAKLLGPGAKAAPAKLERLLLADGDSIPNSIARLERRVKLRIGKLERWARSMVDVELRREDSGLLVPASWRRCSLKGGAEGRRRTKTTPDCSD